MLIKIENLSHTYLADTPQEVKALININLEIKAGEIVGIMGHTGSGKSTLIQSLNGLLKPSQGKITVGEQEITVKKANLRELRQQVGLVFQFPEYQLFEDTVYNDIAFGPRNMGLQEDEVEKRVIEACKLVELDFANINDKSPLALSGGQKRRVAIAGVLAMKPKVLILDEPTAGLDPKGRNALLEQFKQLHKREELTIIMVSHSMDELASICERILVLQEGKLLLDGTPGEIFSQGYKLLEHGLDIPSVTKLMLELQKKGYPVSTQVFSLDQAEKVLCEILGVEPDG